MASWRAIARPSAPRRSMISSWMWFQAMASAPVAAGAAIGMTWSTARGRSSATSRVIIPPRRPAGDEREPPDAQAVGEGPDGAGLVAGRGLGEGGAPRLAGGGVDGGRPGGPVAAAEQVGAQDADPVGVEGPPGPDERRPPVAGGVGRAGERVDDQHLRRVRPGAVVPVGEGHGQGGAALERRTARGRRSRAARSRGGAGRRSTVVALGDAPGRTSPPGWACRPAPWRAYRRRRPARPWTRSQRGGPGRGRRGCRRCARCRPTGG